MRKTRAIALLFFLALPCVFGAQEPSAYYVTNLDALLPGTPPGSMEYDFATGNMHGTNMLIEYDGATLTADRFSLNEQTGETVADGTVRIEQANQLWISDHLVYNFKTHQIESGKFRTGKPPVYGEGQGLKGNQTNQIYTARKVYVTTDTASRPDYYIRASRMKIVPGKYVEAWNAVLYVKGIPMFYFPYYRRELGMHMNLPNVMPGDDTLFGPFLLGTYRWRLGTNADGLLHLDYREKRGVAGGPDADLHLGRWGDAQAKYYYLHDLEPNESISSNSFQNIGSIPKDRQRFYLGWQAAPDTNLEARALVNYQSDQLILHDYFQSDYGENPQPNTFVEAEQYVDNNWGLDLETTPRVNSFFDQVERLPDAQLTGFRQQVFHTPVYYESQSSVGYYERYFAGTNTLFGATNFTMPDFAAPRADTFHQLLLPETFFGWLNVTPRAGVRGTWYGPESGPGGTNDETARLVFNTGGDVSFKASRLWPEATNSLLEINGLRHIIVPSVSYVYVPRPNVAAPGVAQFDTQLPSLMVLPVEFPDYNDIDAIESENVLRFGLRNTLQTERDGQLDNLLDWNLMLDWNLTPNEQTNSVFLERQKTFDDLYSDLIFKPRSWIALESQLRYSLNNQYLNMAFHQVTFTPNDRWSWAVGHWYLRDGFVDSGDNVVTSTLFYRLNDNWGLRATQYYNMETGKLQEQFYSIYRDMRSWTAAVTFRMIDNGGGQPVDYGFAFSISLKARPHYHVGEDTVTPYEMLGE